MYFSLIIPQNCPPAPNIDAKTEVEIGKHIQRVAFKVAGFYAGGYLAITLVQSFGWGMPDVAVSLAGGIIGAVLAALVMDWAIIVLSSLVGSGLIVAALSLQSLQGALLGAALAAVGIFVQATFTRKKLDTQPQDYSE